MFSQSEIFDLRAPATSSQTCPVNPGSPHVADHV